LHADRHRRGARLSDSSDSARPAVASSAQNVIDQFPALKSRSIDDYVDTAVLDGLKKDGFFAEMERKYAKR